MAIWRFVNAAHKKYAVFSFAHLLPLCPSLATGHNCHGTFRPGRNVAILNFLLGASTVTITYRAMDLDSKNLVVQPVKHSRANTPLRALSLSSHGGVHC